jgi:hypothetical protein
MTNSEGEIKKSIRRMKRKFPCMDTGLLEKELIPLQPGEEIAPTTAKRKRKTSAFTS